MKFSTIVIILAVAAVAAVGLYSLSSSSPENDRAYAAALLQERRDKNKFMKDSEESPFGDDRASFDSLNYFPPDIRYKVRAALEPVENKKVIVLPTSTGEKNRYLEYGWATFTLDGQDNRLLILESMDMGPSRGTLFLAFADATSAAETYGAGRYLELKKVPGASSIELDFNKAYNPYCAYTDKFSCPFPPKENLLNVGIRAGEKTYH